MKTMSNPWLCQALFANREDRIVTLDVIAMGPCPFDQTDIASGTPLALSLQCHDSDECELLSEWVRDGRLIAIRQGHHDGTSWLHLSGTEGRTLVMQLH